ncbi:amidohydrolase [Vibrio sinaloensis]|uniref:amidohydrolase n=1 Tax=Photobacterium sp. (strain ATCC 43367) TaxID=379097 RepID=UPI00057FF447|nr:amidohydrolase [Vibrio sinaloensis]KHT50387.1 urease [Vibrio sinaloensis]
MTRLSSTALAISLILSANAAFAQTADMLISNAKIYQHPDADTLVIAQGSIVHIGTKHSAAVYKTSTTHMIDAEQAFLMPGFIDNHNHVFEADSEAGGQCELSMSASLQEQRPYLEACKAQNTGEGWLMGYGFSLEAILGEHNHDTPLDVIDSVFPNQPVILMEQTSHSMWVNSAALAEAGITSSTPDPQGGRILKDEYSQKLNGILLDNAGDQVMEIAWNALENQFEQSYQGLMNGLEEAASHGITTIGDGRLYWKRGWFDVWKQAEKEQDLTARVSLRPWIYPADPVKPQLDFLKRVHSKDTSRRLLVNQVKMYSDGIFINGTAKTLAPYLDTYLPNDPYGINCIPPKQMKTWLNELDRIGYGAHIHAIGDGAIRESLDAIASVRSQSPHRPYTLTHVELVNAKDRSRFKTLDVTADFQVGSDYVAYHDHQWAQAFLGATRARALMNLRALFNAGVNVTLSSDWNVHDINPLVGIANSVKMGETGLPSVDAAIKAYTINAAKSLGISDITGSIVIGKSADLVLIDDDITQLMPNDISKATVLMTMLQGEIVYEAQ